VQPSVFDNIKIGLVAIDRIDQYGYMVHYQFKFAKLFMNTAPVKDRYVPVLTTDLSNSVYVLIKKPYQDKALTVFVDHAGKVRGKISNKKGEVEAFSVRGIPAHIFNPDPSYLEQLREALNTHCYLTSQFDDIDIVGRLPGGVLWQAVGVATGVGQIAGGVALTVMTGGWGAWAGGGLISSGLQAAMYSVTTAEEELAFSEYCRQVAIGGSTGLVSGGIGGLAAKSGLVVKTGVQAIAGAAGKVTSVAVDAGLHGRDVAEELDEKVGRAGLVSGAVAGALSGVVGGQGSKLSQRLVNKVETKLASAVAGGVCGGAAGAVSGAGATLATNYIEGKKDVTENVGASALLGGIMGAAIGAVSGAQQHGRKIPKGSFVKGGKGKGYIIGNSSDKNLAPNEEQIKTAEKYGSVDLATGKPLAPEIIEAIFANEEAYLAASTPGDKPDPFFNNHKNKKALLDKLGLPEDSPQAIELKKMLSRIENRQGVFKDLDQDVTKQMGHVRAEDGVELIDPKHIKGPGRIIAPPGGGQIHVGKESSGSIVDLEGNFPRKSIALKFYAQCQQLSLAESPTEIVGLRNAILSEYAALCVTLKADVIFGEWRRSHTENPEAAAVTRDAKVDKLTRSVVADILASKDKAYLMSSGFKGHAIYHKFVMHDGVVDIMIYNGGEGADHHITNSSSSVYPYRMTLTPEQLHGYVTDLIVCKNVPVPGKEALPQIYQGTLRNQLGMPSNTDPYPLQSVGNCSHHNLTVAAAEDLGGLDSHLARASAVREIRACERLRIEGQGMNYATYYSEHDIPTSGLSETSMTDPIAARRHDPTSTTRAAAVFATAAMTIPLAPGLHEPERENPAVGVAPQ
jgi:hypothetical protein